ncbi:MAG: lipopolysaccharide assembly protein LapA domain-containing protein [Candidatus Rokuibacteriota bacterium]
MQGLLVVVALLLLGVAVFAFQNPDAVTVRFLHWQLSASVAVLTIAAAATGALSAALASFATRFLQWRRRPGDPPRPDPPPVEPPRELDPRRR